MLHIHKCKVAEFLLKSCSYDINTFSIDDCLIIANNGKMILKRSGIQLGGFYFFGGLILVFLLSLGLLSFGVFTLWKLFVKA